MGQEETEEKQTLTEPLIEIETPETPETQESLERQWTKGELQPPQCRDAWAALLFYAQFIAIIILGGVLGIPSIREINDADNKSEKTTGDLYYMGLIYVTLISGGTAFILSALSLFVMSMCPKVLIQVSLLFSIFVAGFVAIYSFILGSTWGGIFGIVFFFLSCGYAYVVWNRIPLAAANLNTGLTAAKKNSGLFFLAYMFTVFAFLYFVVWMASIVGVYDKEGNCEDGVCSGTINGLYFFLLLLAFFWTEQVLQNTLHVTIAGVVSTWWFVPEEASSCCSPAIGASLFRATTYSFGSICFGSLLVAVIQTLRKLVQNSREENSDSACAAFMLCIVDCLLSCLQGIMEYFNKWAYIYVGMYGYSFFEAGKNVMTLFQQKGWTIIIKDDLLDNTLSLMCLVIGCLVGCIGLIIENVKPSWFTAFEGSAPAITFGFSFLIGVMISSIMLSVVDSSVDTVVVCFAEASREFEENHPKLSSEMREAWRHAHPTECDF